MPRKKIADLLGTELASLQTPVESKLGEFSIQQQEESIPDLQTSRVTNKQPLEQTDSEPQEVPKYLQLERKEVRLRSDQIDDLTKLSRKLNRIRKGKGERLTENTLIRVAITLLLENVSQLQGLTENELLESLGLPPVDEI